MSPGAQPLAGRLCRRLSKVCAGEHRGMESGAIMEIWYRLRRLQSF
jgi:hypothetical protein